MIKNSQALKKYGKNILEHVSKDPSSWILILTNLITVGTAVIQQWSINNLLWIYWSQSIIIGFFSVIKILSLKKFSTKDFLIDDQKVKPNKKTKITTAIYFVIFFGFFHFIYWLFLNDFITTENFNKSLIIKVSILFFINHLFSFIYNFNNDQIDNIGHLAFRPLYRIFPIHLTFVFTAVITLPVILILVFFVAVSFIFFDKVYSDSYIDIFANIANIIYVTLFYIIKILADVSGHVFEHSDNFYKNKQLK